jgi:hypothetical protein
MSASKTDLTAEPVPDIVVVVEGGVVSEVYSRWPAASTTTVVIDWDEEDEQQQEINKRRQEQWIPQLFPSY